MKQFFKISFFILFSIPVFSQNNPSGFWEGVLTFRASEHRFEMQIVVKKKKISGVAYLYKTDNEVVTMKIFGKLYWDHSMNIYDLKLTEMGLEEAEKEETFSFQKEYQLVYNRSLWDSTLEGFWQEQIPELLDEHSKKGRIFLKRAKKQPKSKV